MLTIDTDIEDDDIVDENCSVLTDRIKNKKKTSTSKECKYDNNKGEIIGKGQFGTIYEFIGEHTKFPGSNKNKYVIKDSNVYAKINKTKHKAGVTELQLKILDQHDDEIFNIENYIKIAVLYYPYNFVKCYDTIKDCACCIKCALNESMCSSDSNDDEFLVNQMVLDRVFGATLDKYNELNDSEDMKLIFLQLVFITINMNMNGGFHNDIKMDNIMIEKSENIELKNFEYVQKY